MPRDVVYCISSPYVVELRLRTLRTVDVVPAIRLSFSLIVGAALSAILEFNAVRPIVD